ncbi:uncharacterized protein LOC106013910 [Aplysia californica]|uniref:Uncharacterized protein LOC106013910 n=1 Tax=Aplysia californica TaxID=6500 RepID=A0ABM1AEM9_APLCA|nr:uncharacterized protein LOC106013910 [Aplysia californica]
MDTSTPNTLSGPAYVTGRTTASSGEPPENQSEFENDMTLSDNSLVYQVLLPASCAVFIIVVVLVIACCLIKKKKKNSEEWRKKSVHTIESHDGPEYGIYDVIDEVKSSPFRHQEKPMSSRCDEIYPHHVPGGNGENASSKPKSSVFVSSASSLAHGSPRSFDFASSNNERVPCNIPASASASQCVSVLACQPMQFATLGGSKEEEEERIYETLDKNWKLKYEEEKLRSLGRNQTSGFGTAKPLQGPENSQAPVWSHNALNVAIQGIPCQCAETTKTNKVVPEIPKQPGKLVCQISLYEISEETSSLKATEANYYYIFQQEHTSAVQHSKNDTNEPKSFPFRNVPLQIASLLPQDTNLSTPLDNFILEPVRDPQQFLAKRLTVSENTGGKVSKQNPLSRRTSLKNYENIKKPTHSLRPAFLLKKSESFKDPACSQKTSVQPKKRSDSFSSSLRVRPVVKPFEMTPETARILSKLGPLPPVPTPSVVAAGENVPTPLSPNCRSPLARISPATSFDSDCHMTQTYPKTTGANDSYSSHSSHERSQSTIAASQDETTSNQTETTRAVLHVSNCSADISRDSTLRKKKPDYNNRVCPSDLKTSSHKDMSKRLLKVENPNFHRRSGHDNSQPHFADNVTAANTATRPSGLDPDNHYFILEANQRFRNSNYSSSSAYYTTSDEEA